MLIGYARASTDDQDTAAQVRALKSFPAVSEALRQIACKILRQIFCKMTVDAAKCEVLF
jgi:DNA invertase Pin-like site-specific DNA recombinase